MDDFGGGLRHRNHPAILHHHFNTDSSTASAASSFGEGEEAEGEGEGSSGLSSTESLRPEHQPCSNPPQTTSPEANDGDDRMCRICLGGACDSPSRLISPCRCKGSMRFVHLDCLNQWRTTSAKKSAFYQCDQCKFKYSFARIGWAKCFKNELVVTLTAVAVLVLMALVFGFIMKAIVYYSINSSNSVGVEDHSSPHEIHSEDDQPLSDLDYLFDLFISPVTSLTSSTFWSIDLPHFIFGFVTIGIFGCLSLIFSLFSSGPFGTGFGPRFSIFRNRDRGGGNDAVTAVILLVVIVVGIAKTCKAQEEQVEV